MRIPSLAIVDMLKQAVEQTMVDTASILRVVRTRDNAGGWITTTETVATLPCSYRQILITPREQEATTTVRAISFWRFIFPAGSDVRSTDQIQVGTRTWEVVGGGEQSYETRRAITAMEIL